MLRESIPIPLTRLILIFILVATLAGLWCSDQLLGAHDATATGGSASKLFQWCSSISNHRDDCEVTAKSAWSDVRIPIVRKTVPVAMLGWSYFLFLGVWFAVNGSNRTARGFVRWIPLSVALGGGYASIFFISLMAFGRVPWCPACVLCHILNALLILGIAADSFPARTPTARHFSPQSLGRILLVVALVSTMILLLNRSRAAIVRSNELTVDLDASQQMIEAARADQSVLLAAYRAQPFVTIPQSGGDISPSKPHRLVVFTDMQCPACAANAIAIRDEIIPAFRGTLGVEIRHFPLCTDCNSATQKNIHPDACTAAYAAEAARQLGGPDAFASMTSALHEHRDQLSLNLYDQLATQFHLPLEQFNAAMNSPSVHAAVQADIELGKSLGVVNTPTLFLDGRQVPQLCMTRLFWKSVATPP